MLSAIMLKVMATSSAFVNNSKAGTSYIRGCRPKFWEHFSDSTS